MNRSANDGCLKEACSFLYDLWPRLRTRVDQWRWMQCGQKTVEEKVERKEERKAKTRASRKVRAAGPKMEERRAKEESHLSKVMARKAKAWALVTTVANQATMPRTAGPRR